jgi:XTP/dITP diphosphohydrolase
MSRTVVVLPSRWTGVLPVAAVPALRAAARVYADATVPDDVCAALGATRPGAIGSGATVPGDEPEVLFTTEPTAAGVIEAGVIEAGVIEAGVIEAADPPGSKLLDAAAVMDRLRSPGGCPWDAEQTHESLLPYLIEECYELYQAIEDGDPVEVREELGDVLLQVLFHARVAAEAGGDADGSAGFDIDDVADDLVAKLVGRHPHVFAPTGSDTAEKINTAERQQHRWDELKRAEKQRESSVDGVALGQPAVALAAKLISRTARAGLPAELLPAGSGIGDQLFATAAAARLAGIDPEAELRTSARRFAETVRAAEQAARDAGEDPHRLDATGWARFWPRTAADLATNPL